LRYSFKADFFKALSHRLRIQILDTLRPGPLSVGEIKEKLGSSSRPSQQLAVLRARNLVRAERSGTNDPLHGQRPGDLASARAARQIFDNQLVSVRTTLEDLRREG